MSDESNRVCHALRSLLLAWSVRADLVGRRARLAWMHSELTDEVWVECLRVLGGLVRGKEKEEFTAALVEQERFRTGFPGYDFDRPDENRR